MARPAKGGDGDELPGRAALVFLLVTMSPPLDTGTLVPEGFLTRWIPPGGREGTVQIQRAYWIPRWVRDCSPFFYQEIHTVHFVHQLTYVQLIPWSPHVFFRPIVSWASDHREFFSTCGVIK